MDSEPTGTTDSEVVVRFDFPYFFCSLELAVSGRSAEIPCWRSTVVECRSLTGELSLSCARPVADR